MSNSIEQRLVTLLKNKQIVLSTAESCTGGMIASSIVNISGASSIFKEGYVTYSDQVKHKLLGVKNRTLKKYKAVSKETAKEMAIGCARKAKSDISVAVTGVAGPDTEDGKPVGLVYIGCYYKHKVYVKELHLSGNRQEIRQQAAALAMKLIIYVINQ